MKESTTTVDGFCNYFQRIIKHARIYTGSQVSFTLNNDKLTE